MDICKNTDSVIKALYMIEHALSQREYIETDRGRTCPQNGFVIQEMRFLNDRILATVRVYMSPSKDSKYISTGLEDLVLKDGKVYTEDEWIRCCAKQQNYER